MSEILISKLTSVERCIARVREDYDGEFRTNYTKQDAIVLNIERACQQCMDMAAHYIRKQRLGVPENSRHLYEILAENDVISTDLADQLKRMVGFRNVAVHNYTNLDLNVVEAVVTKHLDDFREFGETLVSKFRT